MKNRNLVKIILALIMMCALLQGAAACTTVQVKSAYDVAVENGFVGTQTEWLASLKGADGKNGFNGRDGSDGLELTVADLFDEYLKTHPGATFEGFLNDYLNLSYTPIEDAVNVAIRSVVGVECKFTETTYDRWGRPTTQTVTAAGSGVIYDMDRDGYTYIITNYHVVYDSAATGDGVSTAIAVYTYGDFSTVAAAFVGGSMNNDIAVIRIDAGSLDGAVFRAAGIADSNGVRVGQSAVAVGNPEGEGISATAGVVSVDSETIQMAALNGSSTPVNHRVIRVDTPINPGNSGGGLFNADGELLGIVNAKIVDSSVEAMGYAIPANVAVGIAENVLSGGGKKCDLGRLGATQQIRTSKAVYSGGRIAVEEDLEITAVTAGGFADGKLQVGDILSSASLNGGGEIVLDRIFKLPDFLLNARAGDVLTLTVLRGEVPTEVEIVCAAGSFAAL
jgi:serine protease Do